MEKKVENPPLSTLPQPTQKTRDSSSNASDGLELARLFQQMTVRTKGHWRGENQNDKPIRLKKQEKFKPKIKKRQKSIKKQGSSKILLKPSKLNLSGPEKSSSGKNISKSESTDNFSNFLTDCSREIATIEVVTIDDSELQKQRKSSTCAQQAREEHDHVNVDFSIDVLTDYLEETVLLPKKMSYMAELMYT